MVEKLLMIFEAYRVEKTFRKSEMFSLHLKVFIYSIKESLSTAQ